MKPMNKKQTIILVIGALLIVLRLLFPVMHIVVSGYADGLYLNVESNYFSFSPILPCKGKTVDDPIKLDTTKLCRLDADRTLFQALAIAVISGTLWIMARKKGANSQI